MKVHIEVVYKTPTGAEAAFSSEMIQGAQALLIAEDFERTGRVKSMKFMDAYEQVWDLKKLKEYMKEYETEPHNITVYFDGGFDQQSRVSGLGCVVYYEQNGKAYRLRKNARVEELESNNEAEYAALHLGLQEVEALGVHHMPIQIIGDSKVVIHQLLDEWPCYEDTLSRWADRIEEKLQSLHVKPEYEAVSRKKNQESDRLATQALKGVEISSTIET